jgi:hypothetical protein
MKRFVNVAAIIIVCLLSYPYTVHGAGLLHTSSARLILHGGIDIDDEIRLETAFLPAFNLVETIDPILYLGTKLTITEWFKLELYGGWLFKPNEVFAAISFDLRDNKKCWAWGDFEIVRDHNMYYFIQMEHKINEWLHSGIEMEGWGNYDDWLGWSHGGGPNILFLFEKFGLELAVHTRKSDPDLKIQPVMRFHIFL